MNLPWTKKYKIKCPDGTTKMVYKNVDDALPVYVKGYEKEFKANAKGLEEIEGEIANSSKSKIDGMLYSLDYFNNSLQMEFRAIYLVYETDPCSNGELFSQKIYELIEKYSALNSLKLKIYGLVEAIKSGHINDTNFSENYLRLVSDNKDYLPVQASQVAIQEASKAFKQLKESNHEEE